MQYKMPKGQDGTLGQLKELNANDKNEEHT